MRHLTPVPSEPDTLLARVSQWWGYEGGDGTLIVRPYTGMAVIAEAEGLGLGRHVRGPFLAASEGAARGKLSVRVQMAKAKAADRAGCPIEYTHTQA